MNPTLTNATLLVARIFLGVIFIMAGLGKTGDVAGFAGYMASGGIPAALAWPVILFEIVVGVMLVIGLQTRVSAIALGVFCIVAGALYHFVPADQMQMTQFLKNLAMAGGYFAIALTGAGAWSIDAAMGKKTTLVPAE